MAGLQRRQPGLARPRGRPVQARPTGPTTGFSSERAWLLPHGPMCARPRSALSVWVELISPAFTHPVLCGHAVSAGKSSLSADPPA